jgi:hypothetical protein
MRVFPQSWMSVALAPLKAYAFVAIIIALVWSRDIRGEPMLGFMALGYAFCVLILLTVAVFQRITGRREAALGTFLWSIVVLVLGFVFSWRWLPTLAE